ncbi:MAG: MBL fold metallo-hydrolase [Candidatus Diapherotrites archaeon]|uniref:MBL fold metallo-hydrolase n=1 Tax=Candidatus Iainarchaeum sp. TaxID=3101447 RepID=A0A7J4JWS1_9ARCH|nr:MBL fold metallo-hydrolase [Candidatus Diapherotrites archaeon]HIH21099.1 hypothetical protein [Candidatus Diapherotrites archaeon]
MVELRFFRHSFFQLSANGKNILIDPFLDCKAPSPEMKALVKSPVQEKDFKDVSLILVSHEHYDHFDKKFIESIASKQDSLVAAHDSVLNELNLPKRQLVSIATDSSVNVRNASIKAFPAHHPHSFYPLSFLIELNGVRIFHAGDTDLMEEHEKIKADVAILPIGGASTMDLVDAVKAVKCMKPKVAIPMSYNTFSHIQADPLEFKARIEKSNLKTKPVILQPGESFKLSF